MGNGSWVFLLVALVVGNALVAGVSGYDRYEGDEEGGRGEGQGQGGGGGSWGGGGGYSPADTDRFILRSSRPVVQTPAGSMTVVKGVGGRFPNSPMHIGFITMEPNSLFIPQYLDSSLILFVRRGEARIGSIYEDDFAEDDLKAGDIYRIQSGSAFYLVNRAEGQRLHVICSIDTSESLSMHDFQSFYIGGGQNPTSVLSGFDRQTLATALNVSYEDVGELLNSQQMGAIVYFTNSTESPGKPSVWKKFLEQDEQEKQAHMRRIVHVRGGEGKKEQQEEEPKWSFRKLLISWFAKNNKDDDRRRRGAKSLNPYNIYDRKPGFRNDYGWSTEVNEDDYEPLKESDIGAYLVNLTAGSMMAPHVNPRATEYGVVLSGTGKIQVVYPNGTLAMNAEVKEGDVFWIPRYFPFCQVASRTGPFEFFGFSTSARRNRPQFLVGQNSLLQTMMGPELAVAFGMPEDRLNAILDAQRETTILPSPAAAPPGGDESSQQGQGQGKGGDRSRGDGVRLVDRLESAMVMGFDRV